MADPSLEKQILKDVASGNFLSPERCRLAVSHIREKYGLPERHACCIVSQPRGTQCYVLNLRADEDALTHAIIAFAAEYGRYGYRRITALLQRIGWKVGRDWAQRV